MCVCVYQCCSPPGRVEEGSSGPRVYGWGAGLAAPTGVAVAQRSTLRCAVVACQCHLCVCVCVLYYILHPPMCLFHSMFADCQTISTFACSLNGNNTRMPGMALAVVVQLGTTPNMHSFEMPTHLSQFAEQCLMHFSFNTIEWLAPCMWTTHINYINNLFIIHRTNN